MANPFDAFSSKKRKESTVGAEASARREDAAAAAGEITAFSANAKVSNKAYVNVGVYMMEKEVVRPESV